MPTFSRGDVIRVPFPYTDRDTTQRRPALVVSDGSVGPDGLLLWVLMITSSENRPWPGDVPLGAQAAGTGLPAPSVVRTAKIATIETSVAESLGRVSARHLAAVDAAIGGYLGRPAGR